MFVQWIIISWLFIIFLCHSIHGKCIILKKMPQAFQELLLAGNVNKILEIHLSKKRSYVTLRIS